MEGLNGVLFHGLLKSTALVVSSTAPAAVQVAARLARVVFGDRIQICDGVNDHLEIQAALDNLPAAGGEVFLLEGTYNCQVSVDVDSYQTLRGCGWNTILTTATADLFIITALGGAGTELTGITIADLQVDGGAGYVSDVGIFFEYVDASLIQNVWSRRNGAGGGTWLTGIYLGYCDECRVIGNTVEDNDYGILVCDDSEADIVGDNATYWNGHLGIVIGWGPIGCTVSGNIGYGDGIRISGALYNTVSGNNCTDGYISIQDNADYNTVTGNIIQAASNGIIVSQADYNVVSSNVIKQCVYHGILIQNFSVHNAIEDNIITEASQGTTNTSNCINVASADYNTIQGNVCRAGGLANKPAYGIYIQDAASDKNFIANNDLHDDGFGTGPIGDVGTCTIIKDNNRGIFPTDVKDYVYVKNTSGGASAIGDVARHKAVAAGNEYDTPVANGEDSVLGMVAEVINNNAFGYVMVLGKTVVLKSTNAGGNINIGDYLCTENGVRARLAAAGDMAFARALEACAAANCTIDALLIKPMKI